jgi:excisionase family DNA binding protein
MSTQPLAPCRELVSIPKACKVVGVSRRTIYNWIHDGKVEYQRTAGGSIRIFADTLFRAPGPMRPATGAAAVNR